MNRWVAQWRLEQQVRAHRQRPVVTVRVRDQVAVTASPDEVWGFLTAPGDARLDPEHVRSFLVPGTSTGAVGEVECTVTRRPDGSWAGTLQEVIERVEGERVVLRVHGAVHGHVDTLTVGEGVLTCEVAAEAHPETARATRAGWSAALPVHLSRVAAVLAGEVPPPLSRPVEPGCDDASPLVDVEVTATREVPYGPDVLWALVGDARNVALESADPRAVSFAVPGSPAGAVGEVVCLITGTRYGGREAVFEEVTSLDPGRSIVRRGLSGPAEHAWERELSVEPTQGGARVSHRVRVPAHRRQAAWVRAEHGRLAARHLRVLQATLARHSGDPAGR